MRHSRVMKVVDLPVAMLDLHPRTNELMPLLSDAVAYYKAWAEKPGNTDSDVLEEAADLANDLRLLGEDMEEHGVQNPLRVVRNKEKPGRYLVAEGRTRLGEAKTRGIKTLPCVIIGEDQVDRVIMGSLKGKRVSKTLIAWVALKKHPHLAEVQNGGDRRSQSVRSNRTDPAGFSHRTELAAAYGVSADLIDQLAKVYKRWLSHVSERPKIEAMIMRGVGASYILPGLGGAQATEGEERLPTNFSSTVSPIKALAVRLAAWASWKADEREAFITATREMLSGVPEKAIPSAIEALGGLTQAMGDALARLNERASKAAPATTPARKTAAKKAAKPAKNPKA